MYVNSNFVNVYVYVYMDVLEDVNIFLQICEDMYQCVCMVFYINMSGYMMWMYLCMGYDMQMTWRCHPSTSIVVATIVVTTIIVVVS